MPISWDMPQKVEGVKTPLSFFYYTKYISDGLEIELGLLLAMSDIASLFPDCTCNNLQQPFQK